MKAKGFNPGLKGRHARHKPLPRAVGGIPETIVGLSSGGVDSAGNAAAGMASPPSGMGGGGGGLGGRVYT